MGSVQIPPKAKRVRVRGESELYSIVFATVGKSRGFEHGMLLLPQDLAPCIELCELYDFLSGDHGRQCCNRCCPCRSLGFLAINTELSYPLSIELFEEKCVLRIAKHGAFKFDTTLDYSRNAVFKNAVEHAEHLLKDVMRAAFSVYSMQRV